MLIGERHNTIRVNDNNCVNKLSYRTASSNFLNHLYIIRYSQDTQLNSIDEPLIRKQFVIFCFLFLLVDGFVIRQLYLWVFFCWCRILFSVFFKRFDQNLFIVRKKNFIISLKSKNWNQSKPNSNIKK